LHLLQLNLLLLLRTQRFRHHHLLLLLGCGTHRFRHRLHHRLLLRQRFRNLLHLHHLLLLEPHGIANRLIVRLHLLHLHHLLLLMLLLVLLFQSLAPVLALLDQLLHLTVQQLGHHFDVIVHQDSALTLKMDNSG